ncbi:MAG: zf-TFIIB domain-containing protein [Deltaproteobacteria bacterium]|nr:zf-TFIIB domain-containing protein [Deltaproteobacteria bacterium]
MLVTCSKCNRHVDTGSVAAGDVVQCSCGMGIMVPEGPAAAGKMNCPACGAPVDPDLKNCIFCDTKLATVICPACFGAIFEGSKHCAHCGENLQQKKVVIHGDQTEHICPRCPNDPKLRVEVVAGFPLERCPECEGMWVDDDIVDRIYKDRENAPTVQSMTKSSKADVAATGGGLPVPEGYIKCPICDKMMNRKNFGRFSGVIIDICKGHGTWFDADELRRIMEFIAAGGLEKQAEREREDLRQELRWLKQKKNLEAVSDRMNAPSHGAGLGMGGINRSLAGSAALGIGSLLRKLF